jgi:hypothetical protein
MCIAGRNNDPANRDNEVDDDLLLTNKLLAKISSKGILIGGS